MTISSSDLKFFASERMIDDLSTAPGIGGGGYMSQTEVIDGAANNVFPNVMPGDRVSGVVQLRQVYPIVLSADNDPMANACAGVTMRPTDSNIEVVAFTAAGRSSAEAAEAVGTKWNVAGAVTNGQISGSSSNVVQMDVGVTPPAVGTLVYASQLAGTFWIGTAYVPFSGTTFGLRLVTAVSGQNATIDGAAITSSYDGSVTPRVAVTTVGALASGTRVSAVSHTTASASAAATSITVDKLWAAVQLPGASSLDTVGEPSGRSGMLPLYLPGDQLLIENGSTREVAVVGTVDYSTGDITLTAGLANSYASGSKVTRPVGLGVLQAAANNVFAQQTWTRTWSDSAIGVGITSRYSGLIPMTNDGGATDRWACVFTSGTAFNLISERLGQIASGDTGTDFSPLNPATNQPYFTLLATGWGSGWLPGNAMRFNTRAASAPLWLSRLVLPSSPGGTDQATLFLRGDV